MKKGFTLIEMLIYIGILTIIILFTIYFVSWGIKMSAKSKASQEVLENAKFAMEKIIFEIRSAKEIYTPTSVFDAHPGQLSLKTQQNLPEGENATYADFYLENEKIYLKRESQNPQALTSERVKVTNLVFRHLNSAFSTSSIQAELKIEYKTSSKKPEWQAQTFLISTATLRK